MKPLAHWAIHRKRTLRLHGRNDAEIWGVLVAPDGTAEPFRFHRQDLRLVIGDGEGSQSIQLDAYGFEQAPPADEAGP